ncbi:MAG TPA: adenosylmethionine decarboxylase [Stellaceae bacterium]|jgi:S-adenosylmethionine decarboxylase
MNFLGHQVVLDLHDCRTASFDDIAWVEATMLEAARRAEATIVESTFHRFSPHGISGVLVIAESHIAIHTWPEHGYAAIDIFTCGSMHGLRKAADYLIDTFESLRPNIVELRRGRPVEPAPALARPTPLVA